VSGRVDQLVAGFAEGDAISRDARRLRGLLQRSGRESDIFVPADRVGETVRGDCLPLEEYRGRKGDVVLYHYSTSSPATRVFLGSQARRVVRYHNITPAEFFDGYDDDLAAELREAREGLRTVLGGAELVWAVSAFNAEELKRLGTANVAVVPLFFAPEDACSEPDPKTMAKYGGGLRNILFVGRIAPNKCVEELILAFAWYHTCINPASRLILAGSERSCPRYYAMLRMLAARLGLANVCFEGFVNEAQLSACYRSAHLFACTSRHEGYCLPLLEAMANGVPVLTRAIGGMPEALGGSAAMFDEMEPREMAALFQRLLTDSALRGEILDSQDRRLEELRHNDLTEPCRALLAL